MLAQFHHERLKASHEEVRLVTGPGLMMKEFPARLAARGTSELMSHISTGYECAEEGAEPYVASLEEKRVDQQ